MKVRVEALEGCVGVEARADGRQGSLFWFSFPYKPDPDHELLMRQAAGDMATDDVQEGGGRVRSLSVLSDGVESVMSSCPSADTTSTIWQPYYPQPLQKPLSILLVDDSPPILKMTTHILEREGLGVGVAQNGALALEKIRGRWDGAGAGLAYDCILMDLHMPVMDGLETIKRLRVMEKERADSDDYPRHIVIALSADVDENILALTQTAGFDACLTKPLKISMFFEVLHALRPTRATGEDVY